MKYQIFISYRRSDAKEAAIILRENLNRYFNTFLDEKGIGKGENWPNKLHKTLKEAAIILVLIGKNWDMERLQNENDWVLKEIDIAIQEKKRIIPILVNEAEMPSEDQLPLSIKGLPQFQGSKIKNYYADVEGLIKDIRYFILAETYGQEARDLYAYSEERYQFEKILSNKNDRVVYLANDSRLNRKVVIRVFKNIDNPSTLKESILSAIEFARVIPNCVQIFDADFDRMPHVILDYMENGTLRKILDINRNGLPYTNVAQILRDIGEALIRAETNHCNLKPSNILLSKENIPYLNSMSKTKLVQSKRLLEDLMSLASSPDRKEPSYREDLSYLAPEIFDDFYKGLADERGLEKVDQYMLGLLGYELLTGKLPQTFLDVNELGNMPPKTELRNRLGKVKNCADERLVEILYKMTNPDPKDRYALLQDAVFEINKTMVQSIDIDIVRESYLRCLNYEMAGKGFLETFYSEFVRNEEIRSKFEKFKVLTDDRVPMRKQYNHLQGAIFGLIEFANETRMGKEPNQINILRHIAERHGYGDGSNDVPNYFIGARPKHFNHFLQVFLKIVCGDNDLGPFDKNCSRSDEEKEKIKGAWEKVLKPGIEYMIANL